MAIAIKKILSTLLIIPIVIAVLTVPAGADISEEVKMQYKQFSLLEATQSITPPYPFGGQAFAADGETGIRFDEWWYARLEQQTAAIAGLDTLQAFIKNNIQTFFDDGGNSNMLYSPINVWFYLELLSNLTEGNSQMQILQALDPNAASPLADEANSLYKALYWDDGVSVWRPSFSIWLNEHTNLTSTLADKLAAEHHASVFQGPMGERSYDEAFHAWLNEKTNDILKDVVNGLGFHPNDSISLCTSLYLRCSWGMPFDKAETYTDVFYSADGEHEVNFMHKEESGGVLYYGPGFSAVILDLQGGGYVTLVLPDPDQSLEEIIKSDGLFDFFFAGRDWKNVKNGKLKISMPSIDAFAAMPMTDMLTRMGITDIFDPEKAAFSGDIISDVKPVLSSLDQYSRLIMNEDGVEAASIIVSDTGMFQLPSEEELDFTLNRPFLFAVSSETNIPLFFGAYQKSF